MTYRTATAGLLRRHAPATPLAVLSRIETGDQADAAALADQALEDLARRLPPGDYEGGSYGCSFRVTPGHLTIRQGACGWGKRSHWCKHMAREIGRQLAILELRARLVVLARRLGTAPIQPTSCGACGDPVPEGDVCACGSVANSSTVRSALPADQPRGLNR